MKNLITLIITILTTVSITKAQTDPIVYKADKHISVKFPTAPKETTPGTHLAISKDSVVCILTVVDFQKIGGLDSASLAGVKESPNFAKELKYGINQGMKNVQLGNFVLGHWQGLTSYTSSGINSTTGNKYSLFMIINGVMAYSLSTIEPAGYKANTKDDFIASLTYTK